MSDLTRAIALDPADPYLRLDRGVLYGNQGDWSQAQAEYHQGLALRPTRPDWFQQRLWHARTKGGGRHRGTTGLRGAGFLMQQATERERAEAQSAGMQHLPAGQRLVSCQRR